MVLNMENINMVDYPDRLGFESRLHFHLTSLNPDLVILAGWDLILPVEIINSFSNIINIHPALPNTFKGLRIV